MSNQTKNLMKFFNYKSNVSVLSLLEHAAEELYMLNRFARRHEMESLLVKYRTGIDGNDAYRCIYGLMTGSCDTDRAMHLMKRCATTFFASLSGGTSTDQLFERVSGLRNWTALEIALYHFPEKVKILLDELVEAETPLLLTYLEVPA